MRVFISAFILCISFGISAFAANNSVYQNNKEDLDKIAAYLNSIKNFSSEFIQETSDGKVSTGMFYLSRPGKMRIEYKSDPKVLVIVNGSILTYKDVELDEVSSLPAKTTPASMLTRKNISFADSDIDIGYVKKNGNMISVSVIKNDRKDAGEFVLDFSVDPVKFVGMKVKTGLDDEISVKLKNIQTPESLSSSLFVVRSKNLP